MNNSKIIIDDLNIAPIDTESFQTSLRERESELLRLIEVIPKINSNRDWVELKSLLFDNLLVNLEKRLKVESKKETLETSKIHQLQGEIRWAERYSNLELLLEKFRVELRNVRLQIKN